jgi:hypothetical protein
VSYASFQPRSSDGAAQFRLTPLGGFCPRGQAGVKVGGFHPAFNPLLCATIPASVTACPNALTDSNASPPIPQPDPAMYMDKRPSTSQDAQYFDALPAMVMCRIRFAGRE